jgi:signal transduction histidine kinase
MATELITLDTDKGAFSNPLLLARIEELDHLNEMMKDSLEAASRDSEKLQEANAVKDEVLAFVAHELRGPLTTILGNASILLNKHNGLGPSTVHLALQDIQTEARHLQRLIANLLVLARPEQETPVPDEPLDFYHLVRTAVEEHRKGCPQRQLHLTAQETEILVAAHRDYTEEVLINLLSNAEKYSPPAESIEVRLRRAGDHVEASVLDRGPGIAEDEADAIFQPFYRSPMTSSHALGLGLGLAVCKRLIESQGGHIWVAPREGGGSQFAITLPLSRQPGIRPKANGVHP